jgi:hypothetical protein
MTMNLVGTSLRTTQESKIVLIHSQDDSTVSAATAYLDTLNSEQRRAA